MRYIYLLILLVVISSCAHNRIRLRKVDRTERVEVATTTDKKKSSFSNKQQPEVLILEENESVGANEEVISESQESQSNIRPSKDTPLSVESKEEFVEPNEEEPSNAVKLSQALDAEKHARQAKNSMIAAFIMIFIPVVSFLSIIFFIIGSVHLYMSNRYDYITVDGESYARTAFVMQVIYAVFMLLAIALILALFIL